MNLFVIVITNDLYRFIQDTKTMHHILIADSQRSISHMWARGFLEANYTVDVVYTGRETFKYIAANGLPDLLIVESSMRDMSGAAVIAKLKEIDPERHTIVYFVTADPLNIVENLKFVQDNANEVLQKPILLRHLIERVNALFSASV